MGIPCVALWIASLARRANQFGGMAAAECKVRMSQKFPFEPSKIRRGSLRIPPSFQHLVREWKQTTATRFWGIHPPPPYGAFVCRKEGGGVPPHSPTHQLLRFARGSSHWPDPS